MDHFNWPWGTRGDGSESLFHGKEIHIQAHRQNQERLNMQVPGPTHPAQQEHQGMAGVLPLNAALLTGAQLRSTKGLEGELARWGGGTD